MADIFDGKATVWFIGGTGDKTGDDYAGGCTQAWYDSNFTALSDIMGDNGAPLISETNASYDHTGHIWGEHCITQATAGEFADAQVGMIAHISGTNITPGKYEITGVDGVSGNYVVVAGIEATGDAADVTIKIGGALSSMAIAMADLDAGSYTVRIHNNKDDTDAWALDSGGSAADDSWMKILGFNETPGDCDAVNSDNRPTITISTEDAVVVTVGRLALENHVVDGEDESNNGIDITPPATTENTLIRNCKVTNCDRGVETSSTAYTVTVIDCQGVDNDIAFYCNGRFTQTLLGCTVDNNGGTYGICLVDGGVVIGCTINGCPVGIGASTRAGGLILNCTIYGATSACISRVSGEGDGMLVVNCVLHVAAPASAYAIKDALSGITVAVNNWTNADTPIEHESTLWESSNISGDDPMFRDAANGDFTPLPGSPLWRNGHPDVNGNPTHIGAHGWEIDPRRYEALAGAFAGDLN